MFKKFDKSKFMKKAREGVQEELASPDHILVQVVSSIDELNKVANLGYERLSEWYGLHFPEFKHRDPKKYAQIVLAMDRSKPDMQMLSELLGENSSAVLQKANNSMGVHFSPDDIEAVQNEARLVIAMLDERDSQEKYLENFAKRLAPNLCELCGSQVAAKLIAKAGSLKKLSIMPASTVQVIGAEKALFKHLKTGTSPPKHGIIFQHPLISTTPKGARGKIARALAAKIAIASKADAYSHNSIAAKLKEQFEARAHAILRKEKESPKKESKPIFAGSEKFQKKGKSFSRKKEENTFSGTEKIIKKETEIISSPREQKPYIENKESQRGEGKDYRAPKRDGGKPYGERREGGSRSYSDRPRSEGRDYRAPRREGGNSYGDRREGGSRSYGDRREGGRSYGERPRSNYNRPREDGNRTYGDREGGSRSYGERPRSNYGRQREDGNRNYGGRREGSSYGNREGGNRSYGDRPRGDYRGKRRDGGKSYGNREGRSKSYGDRPSRGKKFFGGKKRR